MAKIERIPVAVHKHLATWLTVARELHPVHAGRIASTTGLVADAALFQELLPPERWCDDLGAPELERAHREAFERIAGFTGGEPEATGAEC